MMIMMQTYGFQVTPLYLAALGGILLVCTIAIFAGGIAFGAINKFIDNAWKSFGIVTLQTGAAVLTGWIIYRLALAPMIDPAYVSLEMGRAAQSSISLLAMLTSMLVFLLAIMIFNIRWKKRELA